ncbi:MAG: TlpA family protein disulfide reductase [Thermomicrobiales bacterium]
MEPSQSPQELEKDPATLSQDPEEDQGRIGYGKRTGVYTPLALALIIIATLVGIGIYNQRGDDIPENNIQIGAQAPAIEQATINGGDPFSLAAQTGKVVIVNFWASWCDPCRNEMPLLQETVNANPDALAIVGIDIKNDTEYAAQRFLETNGIAYPIVRDESDGTTTHGPIGAGYGIGTNYPTTVFISPDGRIAAFHIGELNQKQLDELIAKAQTYQS